MISDVFDTTWNSSCMMFFPAAALPRLLLKAGGMENRGHSGNRGGAKTEEHFEQRNVQYPAERWKVLKIPPMETQCSSTREAQSTGAHLDFHDSRAGSGDRPVFLLQQSLLPSARAAPHWAHGRAWESSWRLRTGYKLLSQHAGAVAPVKWTRGLMGCCLAPHPRRNRMRWRGWGNPSRRIVCKTGRLTADGSDHL